MKNTIKDRGISNYEIGDKVAIVDNSKIGCPMYTIKGVREYLIVGIDDEDGCPCIAHEDYTWFLTKDEVDGIMLIEESSEDSRAYIEKAYPYVPPNKEAQYLLIRLMHKNDIRSIRMAIDVALDQGDEEAFKRLVKLL